MTETAEVLYQPRGMTWMDRKRLQKVAGFAVGESVLDIGCAEGPNPFLRGKRVAGFDRKPFARLLPPYTEQFVGDLYDINKVLEGQVFDTITMGEIIEHVEQPFDILRLVHKHVAPGGRLILTTPNVIGLPVIIPELLLLRRFYYTEQHVYCFSPRWVWRILERSGFKMVATKGAGICWAFSWWFPAPAALSYQVIYVATLA
jgi:2-polyprenyl-3-methyl-5-hydroxy-6-metoxy-1,4-benzoquinol methylase